LGILQNWVYTAFDIIDDIGYTPDLALKNGYEPLLALRWKSSIHIF
jgi:hypothetical protein